jgi:hypothetical protein
MGRLLLPLALLAGLSGTAFGQITPDANGLKGVAAHTEDPPPEHLTIGYDNEGKIDASPQACVADVKAETAGWSNKEIEEAARKQCAARKRHVEAYEALQKNYRTLRGLLAQDVRTEPADAAAKLEIMVKACIDHKSGVTTGGHNVMVDVIENDIAAKCLSLGANLLRDEIRELVTHECVPGVPGSC